MGNMLINVSGQNTSRVITDSITEENAGNSYSALQQLPGSLQNVLGGQAVLLL
uniref:Uncharacterized protein n=1 Tax=Serratia marcescens TaxID=615 RepID=A0A1C3HGN6_SERMA|nr:Uncharacterised protein [Serratia marcescens]